MKKKKRLHRTYFENDLGGFDVLVEEVEDEGEEDAPVSNAEEDIEDEED